MTGLTALHSAYFNVGPCAGKGHVAVEDIYWLTGMEDNSGLRLYMKLNLDNESEDNS